MVDPAHSYVGFAVRHLGISTVREEFKEFEGTLEIGEEVSMSRAYGTVRVASVDTRESDRDDHLRSPKFFDAAQFPEIVFESTKIEALDDDDFRITGRLTASATRSCCTPRSAAPSGTPGATSASASKSPAGSHVPTTG